MSPLSPRSLRTGGGALKRDGWAPEAEKRRGVRPPLTWALVLLVLLVVLVVLVPWPVGATPPHWSADERLTTIDAESLRPAIAAASDGELHVVWDDYRNLDHEVYYKNWTGSYWTIDEPLTGG